MGHDVSTIGIHKLDISSIESLANDLSKRFKAHVEYGYYHQFPFDTDGNEKEPTYENVILGKIVHHNASKILWLSDEFYQIHQLFDKYGKKYTKLPFLAKHNYYKEEFNAAKKGVKFEIHDSETGDEYGTIYNNAFHNYYYHFSSRWWGFCKAFEESDNNWQENLNDVNIYRREIMELFSTIGGDKVFHFSDQGKTEYLAYSYYSWQDLEKETSTKFKKTMLNISECIKQNKPLPKDKYPFVFFDDFNDLEYKDPSGYEILK